MKNISCFYKVEDDIFTSGIYFKDFSTALEMTVLRFKFSMFKDFSAALEMTTLSKFNLKYLQKQKLIRPDRTKSPEDEERG
ncbi:hypothetical protein [Pedobacter jejuensis]|uniref:Uncharacterized protein n=1 Tax=Pedobacter jejuensis TaxID=1268550 RepID=A0A3N0BVA3_9SPHI|nr:hypothetical protein [Pedobacter jejuensis]RNL53225.1 hypothetical protein D7004_10530 [Pedobacter jejuensis]